MNKFLERYFTFVIVLLIIILASGCSHTPYIKAGAGYKLSETDMLWVNEHKTVQGNHPVSARLEAGFEAGNWTYGVSHHSQFATGAPFNNDPEYQKTEVFVDYTWRFEK